MVRTRVLVNTERILVELHRQSMYQHELATLAKITPGTVSNLMRSGRSQLITITKIADVLGIPIDELIVRRS